MSFCQDLKFVRLNSYALLVDLYLSSFRVNILDIVLLSTRKPRAEEGTLLLNTILMSKKVKWAVIQCLYINPEVITRSGRSVAYNVLALGEGGDFHHKC